MSEHERKTANRFLSRLFRRSSDSADPLKGRERKVLMHAAENFHILTVSDVMIPRADIVAVEKDITLRDLANAFKEAGHSRLPVYRETLDEPTGLVHVKDLLTFLTFDAKGRTGKTYPNRKIVSKIERPVLFVPPSMVAENLLRRMQARRMHMAIVVDEYGGTDGIVTLEDLIEPIVGDIEDEHDDYDPEIRTINPPRGEPYWEADARANIENFEAVIGREIATPEEDDEVDTLGGVVFTLAGRVPERGEIVRHPYGIEFEVLDADARHIKKVRIRQVAPASKDNR